LGDKKNKDSESYIGGRLKMANLAKTLLIAGSIVVSGIGGYVIGNNSTSDKEYEIKRAENSAVLYNKDVDKEHQLFKIENDFYLGTADHQLKGLKNVTIYEVMKELKLDEKTYKPIVKE